MKVAILGGLGVEGKDLTRYLKKHSPDLKPTILDQKTDPDYLSKLEDFDLIYKTPGVLYNIPEIQKAIQNGVEIVNTIDVFFEKAKGTIIGVTGTKGKGTTVQLIYEVLKAAGKDAYLGGNIGQAPLEFVDKLTDQSITVLELSNVQLWNIRHSPHIAGVLGIFPDHLDWHTNVKEYFGTKLGITKHQTKDDFVFYFPDNKHSKKVAKKSKGQRIAVDPGEFKIELSIPGDHNKRNAAMAAAICIHLGVNPAVVLETAKNYKGLPYRLTKIAIIKGVEYYNDSASTNPETTIAAMEAFSGETKVLILGGKDKKLDYKDLGKVVQKSDVRFSVLFGESKNKIKEVLGDVKSKTVNTLEEAVELASKEAKEGDVILFSPAATSLDMFDNYQARGEAFDRIVKKLKG